LQNHKDVLTQPRSISHALIRQFPSKNIPATDLQLPYSVFKLRQSSNLMRPALPANKEVPVPPHSATKLAGLFAERFGRAAIVRRARSAMHGWHTLAVADLYGIGDDKLC
jgi:hypothetical protein